MNSKKKILYIITQSQWGGAQKYVYDLAANLNSQNFDILVTCGPGGNLIDRLKEKNIKVFVLKNLVRQINPIRDSLAFFEIYKLIKKEKPNIVHINSSKTEILGSLAAKLAGVPKIIFTAHGFVFNEPMNFFKRKIFIWLERLAGLVTDKIIAVSEFDRLSAFKEKIVPASKIVTIHHGLDLNFFGNFTPDLEKKRKELELPDNAVLVGTISNFYKTKGLKYFIKASAQICEKISNVYFIIVGEGELRPAVEKQIQKLNLGKKIILTGFRRDTLEVLAAMDIFVLSSLKEGLPFSLLEAGALGKPVVATKVGGIPEIIKDGQNGILVLPADPQALAKAIFDLIQNKKKAQDFGLSLKEEIFKNFDLSKTIQKTLRIYENRGDI